MQGLSAVSGNGVVALSWTPFEQSRIVGYEITKVSAGGKQTIATTFTPSYSENNKSTGDKGDTYEVQALYLPHGFAGNVKMVKAASGANTLLIGESAVAINAEEIFEASGIVALQRQAATTLQTMSSGTASGASAEMLNSARGARTATVVLRTKVASVVVR